MRVWCCCAFTAPPPSSLPQVDYKSHEFKNPQSMVFRVSQDPLRPSAPGACGNMVAETSYACGSGCASNPYPGGLNVDKTATGSLQKGNLTLAYAYDDSRQSCGCSSETYLEGTYYLLVENANMGTCNVLVTVAFLDVCTSHGEWQYSAQECACEERWGGQFCDGPQLPLTDVASVSVEIPPDSSYYFR